MAKRDLKKNMGVRRLHTAVLKQRNKFPLLGVFSGLCAVAIGISLGTFILAYPQTARVTSNPETEMMGVEVEESNSRETKYYLGSLPEAERRSVEFESPTTTILFVGDMMFDRTVAARSKAGGGADYPFKRIGNLRDGVMGKFDLVIGNLEGPVTKTKREPIKSIDFAFDPSILPALAGAGFDAVSQANNHSLDQGRAGSDESLQLLVKAGIIPFGDQVRQDAKNAMAILENRGKKFAFIGFNNTDVKLEAKNVEAVMNEALLKADYAIIFMHWGNEYREKPTADQVALAHRFVELGAAAVIGGHPHWMESVEVYRNRPIVYSLGNFIFDQDWSKETNYGLVVGLGLSENASELRLFPIKIEKSQPYLLTGVERQARLDRLASISSASVSERIKEGGISLSN